MPLFLEYGFSSKARYGQGRPYGDGRNPHKTLYEILALRRSSYEVNIQTILDYSRYLEAIPLKPSADKPFEPHWLNGFLPELDAATLYAFLAAFRPSRYLEVGSGHSTKFARKAMNDHALSTTLISVDPDPRAEIDCLCDQTIRAPLEASDLEVFRKLQPGDILFVDGSHCALPNSDVVVLFLDILPSLQAGVLVHLHDISLPYDYPDEQIALGYSEQYMLATLLLANSYPFEVIQSNAFITNEPDLQERFVPLWDRIGLGGRFMSGCSLWMKKVMIHASTPPNTVGGLGA